MAIRVGILGCGAMGLWHARRVRELRGYALHSIHDTSSEQRQAAAEEFGCPVYDSLPKFLADRALNLVVVATPSHAHVRPTIAALKAGKHVLCEKPLARTEAEASRMFAAAQKTRRTLMTFQNRRWDSDFLTVRKAVASGRLGRLLDIRLIRWGYTNIMQTFGAPGYRPAWRTEASFGGGTLLDLGAHYLDQLLQLVPQPIETVFGDLRGRRWTRDADDQFLVVLRTRDGLVAQVEYSQNAHVPVAVEWAVSGAKAGFRYDQDRSLICTHDARGAEKVRYVQNAGGNWDAAYHNLRAVLERGAQLAIQPHETLRLMRILDAVRRSALTGQVIRIKDEFAPGLSGRMARTG